MAITSEFISEAGTMLSENCPIVSESPEAIELIKARIVRYDEQMDSPPDAMLVVRWAQEIEKELKAEKDASESARKSRQDARRSYLSPAAADREQLAEENRGRRPQRLARKPFADRPLTEKEKKAYAAMNYSMQGTHDMGSLKGLDLKIGGDWAKALYDRCNSKLLEQVREEVGSEGRRD